MLARLTERYGPIEEITEPGSSAPASRFKLPGGQVVGVIASTTKPFCRTCDRARLTADGVLFLCLYAQHGADLRRPLRAGASAETLAQLIEAVWRGRAEHLSELAIRERRRHRLSASDVGRGPGRAVRSTRPLHQHVEPGLLEGRVRLLLLGPRRVGEPELLALTPTSVLPIV